MLRVSSKRYWHHEKHVLLECTSYEKIIPAKIQSKIWISAPAFSSCFLVARDLQNKKRLKYRVLSKNWTENKAKVVLISVFFTILDQNVTSFYQRWIRRKQPWTALEQLCFRWKQLSNSTEQGWLSLKASDLGFLEKTPEKSSSFVKTE